MGETANPGTDLTAEEAASTIARARSYEEPLRRRTEGVTWMIWSLVPTGAQLTIDALPRYTGTYQGWMDTIPILASRFETRYRITGEGSQAFEAYLDELEDLLEGEGVDEPEPADAEGQSEGQPGPAL